MKKIYLLIIGIVLFIPKIKANSIENIDIDIYVDNNGTAHVTEVWDATLSSGTEGYKPYYNLGESKISNFKVSMNNIDYTFNEYWNVNGTFDNKKYKNGINYINDGVELCFGISRYGSNIYKLTYDISNFVVNTSDNYQMIYWTLFPHNYNPSPKRVYIKIYSDFRYSNTLDVWGYGKGGIPTYVYDGIIEMDSLDTVNSSEYMTILVKFPSNSFNISTMVNKTFTEYLDMANDGATPYDEYKYFKSDIYKDTIIFLLILPGIIIILPFLILRLTRKKIVIRKQYNFGEKGNRVKNNIDYYRDIPCPGDKLAKVYWIASEYNIYKKKEDFLGAILLKWIKEDRISIFKDKRKSKIKLIDDSNLTSWEKSLYSIFKTSSDNDIVSEKKFKKLCKTNYYLILGWFDKVKAEGLNILIEDKLIYPSTNEKYIYDIAPVMYDEAKKLTGLKKFLKDFSNIKDREAIEVHLWQEYLIYAQIFGIAKKVIKTFKDVYPDLITIDNYSDIKYINTISYKIVSMSTRGKAKADAVRRREEAIERARDYDSGGGGFSSSGGGGGSSGGGGGGGGFR